MLTWIFAVGAILCVAYYIIIVMYAGLGTSMAVLWLLLAGLLGASSAGMYYCQKYPDKGPMWIPVSLVTLCASGLVVVLVLQILIFGRIPTTAEPDLDYVIVLGAKVKPEGLSKSLKLRLDKAAEYAQQNPDSILVLSGAQGEDEPTTEAAAMKDYLVAQGVNSRQLLLEETSYSTVENIACSKVLLEQDWNAKKHTNRSAQVGIITNNFHLYRAKMIAQKQGFPNIHGIAAESDKILFVHFCLRDAMAILKDRVVGNI